MLTIGAVLSAFTNSFAGQWVFADSVEPGTVEAGLDTSARCNPEDIAVHAPQPSSTSERPCPADTREAGETARARAYLIATATPGYTMTRQGPERAIERLHPEFVNRLAAAIAEARGAGLPSGSAVLPTNSTRSIPTGWPSTSPGSGDPAPQALCSGTRSQRDTALSALMGRTTCWNGITANRHG
jgi:hypothetical protein